MSIITVRNRAAARPEPCCAAVRPPLTPHSLPSQEEMFREMLKALDEDGDGTVTKVMSSQLSQAAPPVHSDLR